MPTAIALVARHEFDIRGESRVSGEYFETSPLDAVILLNKSVVMLAPVVRTQAPAPVTRRRYQRKAVSE